VEPNCRSHRIDKEIVLYELAVASRLSLHSNVSFGKETEEFGEPSCRSHPIEKQNVL